MVLANKDEDKKRMIQLCNFLMDYAESQEAIGEYAANIIAYIKFDNLSNLRRAIYVLFDDMTEANISIGVTLLLRYAKAFRIRHGKSPVLFIEVLIKY